MHYDMIFLGGGLNYAGAIVAHRAGLKTLLIEENLNRLGGICLHAGCIPSKYMLHFSQTLIDLKSEVFRVHKDALMLDRLQKEKMAMIKSSTQAIGRQLEGVDLAEGKGYVTDAHTVRLGDSFYTADHIIIGTGSRQVVPNGIEYDKIHIITSDEALDLEALPTSLAIYGAGPIALEFATFFAAAGSQTTLIYRGKDLLKSAHPMIRERLKRQLENLGVTLMLETSITEARALHDGVKITTDKEILAFDKLLVATGRTPRIDAIKTEKIRTDKAIWTDDDFETTLKNHYAIGDCNGKMPLAHAARAQVLYVVDKILGKNPKKINLKNIPNFVNTLPLSYASVGLVSSDLAAIEYKESIFRLSYLTLAAPFGAKDGIVILYANKGGFLLGAEIFAPGAAELIGIIETALIGELDVATFRQNIFAHPTFSEAIHFAIRGL